MSIQAKSGIWFIACSFLQKGISFITMPIFTRLLSADEYGTYSLYLSWLQLIAIVTSLNLYYGVLDNGMSKFEDDRDRFISSMQGLTITITTLVFFVYCAARHFWAKVLGLAPAYIILMFIELFVRPAIFFWSGRNRFEYSYKKLVFVTLFKSLANPVLGLLMVLSIPERDYARVLSVVIVEVAFCGALMIIQFVKGKVFYDGKYWKYGLKLAFPMLPHYLSGMILSQGDRIMIEKMVDKASVAFYSVAYSIGMLVQIFTSAINSAITPWFYEKFKTNTEDGVAETTNGLLLFVAGISACLMLLSPELIMIFGSSEYIQGAAVIPPVASSVFFIFLYYVFSLPQFFFEKTRFLFIASLCAAFFNIFLNFFFIKLYGYVAAGYTTLICYVAYSVGHFIVSKKVIIQNMGGKKLFDIKTISLISAVLITFSIVVGQLFDYRFLRFSLLLVGCAVVFWKRGFIMVFFTKKASKE